MEQAERHNNTLTREEWEAVRKSLAEPFHVQDLIDRGLVTKAADGWYVVHDLDALPSSARDRIIAIATGGRVKFQSKRTGGAL